MAAANTFRMQARGDAAATRAAETRLAELRQKLREALAQKKRRKAEFVEACKSERRALREHVQEMRAQSLRDLRDQIQVARGAAKITRLTRLAEVRLSSSAPVEQARAAAGVERRHQEELARLAREERARGVEIRLAHERAVAAGALRSALFGKLAPLFEREGRGIKAAPGESRGEALLRFAEQNSEKVHAVLEPVAHRKIEETTRAVDAAEREVRSVGGDVRAGEGRRGGKGSPVRLVAEPAPTPSAKAEPLAPSKSAPTRHRSPLPAPHAAVHVERPKPSVHPTPAKTPRRPTAKRASSAPVPVMGAAPQHVEHPKPSVHPPAKKPRRPTAKRASSAPAPATGHGALTTAKKTAAPRVKPRRKGEMPTHGPGILLRDLLKERAELAAKKNDVKRRGVAKKAAATKTKEATPAPVGPPYLRNYAVWCDLVGKALGKFGGRVTFGAETHDAWSKGQSPEDFVLALPNAREDALTLTQIHSRDEVKSRAAANTNARAATPSVNPSSARAPVVAGQLKPYKVRASCGHIVVRKMAEATAGVPYSEAVILEAPNGRACEACEAKKELATHAPKPGEKKDVKAPELRDTAQIAARIRADIGDAVRQGKIPRGKYAVTTSKYSMGSSIKVLAKLPFPVLNPDAFKVDQEGKSIVHDRLHFPNRYTEKAEEVAAKLNAIVDGYHWDRSDRMTDYYHERFARDVQVDEGEDWKQLKAKKLAAVQASKGSP